MTAGHSAESEAHHDRTEGTLHQEEALGAHPSCLHLLRSVAAAHGWRGMGLRWQDWLEDFKDFMKGSQVSDPAQQLIALPNLNGKEFGQYNKELMVDTVSSYQGAREALNRKFFQEKNIDYERYSFNLVSQGKDESKGEFISQLKRLAR
ncbi:hypothetical protein NDU88_001077 [Pleurodeles waltl]|uniref:Retrotransposon gag domain-containing protein n=1 Tax=Pleurodeles waltl TaxID=8319 RepID=A0AAV7U8A4_PLEWA|nr:hypothetical protein NDU88_001077 [Pleurodeles waltl]